jgi:hypothetical protein
MRYGYRLVALVDVLGQQDELETLAPLSITADSEKIADIMDRTAGRVRWVRETLSDRFRVAPEYVRPSGGFTPEQAGEYLALRQLTFKTSGIGDTFVVSVPLAERSFGPAQAALATWSTLHSLAATWLQSVSGQLPLRGGIDVHIGLEIFPNEVYGLPLARAHQLESKAAEYPRVLIGDGLLRYLEALEKQPRSTRWNAMAATMASECRRLICMAPDDGRSMLHPLSPDILSLNPLLREFAQKGAAWAHQEFVRFNREGNPKLADRYRRLLTYFAAYGYPPA